MGSQVWSMEKLENKLVDMRDMYEERKDPHNYQRLPAIKVHTFYFSNLPFPLYFLLVANYFLMKLFPYRTKYQGKHKIRFMNPKKITILSELQIFS